jgi:hypothetical protein
VYGAAAVAGAERGRWPGWGGRRWWWPGAGAAWHGRRWRRWRGSGGDGPSAVGNGGVGGDGVKKMARARARYC